METKDNNSKPTTPSHGNHNHHHDDVIKVVYLIYTIKVSIISGEKEENKWLIIAFIFKHNSDVLHTHQKKKF